MRTHLSLVVKNPRESVKFYEKIFGVAPQKQTDTYAKFDLQNPALNFSLVSGENISRVSHLGIEVNSPEEVEEWKAHLADLGLLDRVEEKSRCCYALQDKAWFTDPDGNAWEVFHVYEQLPLTEQTKGKSTCCQPSPRA